MCVLGPRVQDLGFFLILFGPGALGFRVFGARALGFFIYSFWA